MIFDKQNQFSYAQSIAAAAGTVYSDTIDLWGGISTVPQAGVTGPNGEIGGPLVHDIFRGNQPALFAQIVETVTSGGAATIQFKLVAGTGVDGSFNINAGTVTLLDTTAIGYATLVAGYRLRLGLPPVGGNLRYLQMQYIIATATTTAGKITSGLVFDAPSVHG